MVPASEIRLLIVDDDAMMRSLVRRSLKHVGFVQVADARDGKEALEMARSARPHFIISDYEMPRMNGIELVRALRMDPVLSGTGFILLSGVADQQVVRSAVEAGADSFIRKPFSIADLRIRIRSLFYQLTGSEIG